MQGVNGSRTVRKRLKIFEKSIWYLLRSDKKIHCIWENEKRYGRGDPWTDQGRISESQAVKEKVHPAYRSDKLRENICRFGEVSRSTWGGLPCAFETSGSGSVWEHELCRSGLFPVDRRRGGFYRRCFPCSRDYRNGRHEQTIRCCRHWWVSDDRGRRQGRSVDSCNPWTLCGWDPYLYGSTCWGYCKTSDRILRGWDCGDWQERAHDSPGAGSGQLPFSRHRKARRCIDRILKAQCHQCCRGASGQRHWVQHDLRCPALRNQKGRNRTVLKWRNKGRSGYWCHWHGAEPADQKSGIPGNRKVWRIWYAAFKAGGDTADCRTCRP